MSFCLSCDALLLKLDGGHAILVVLVPVSLVHLTSFIISMMANFMCQCGLKDTQVSDETLSLGCFWKRSAFNW